MRRYLKAIAEIPAPSTAAAALRTPQLRQLLADDGALDLPGLHLHASFADCASSVILTGSPDRHKPLWYMAHLDTLSYLVQPRAGERYPLVPFGYHLMTGGSRMAWAWRYDLASNRYRVVADGRDRVRRGRSPTSGPKTALRRLDQAIASCFSLPIARTR